jgi:hypothetical protein
MVGSEEVHPQSPKRSPITTPPVTRPAGCIKAPVNWNANVPASY